MTKSKAIFFYQNFRKQNVLTFISDIDQLTQNIKDIHDSIGNTLRVVRVSVEILLIVSNS